MRNLIEQYRLTQEGIKSLSPIPPASFKDYEQSSQQYYFDHFHSLGEHAYFKSHLFVFKIHFSTTWNLKTVLNYLFFIF